MTIRYCCRCGGKLGVFGLCAMSPDHAPYDTPEDMVCVCGNVKKLEDAACGACTMQARTDSPLTERD